jgi:phosphoglycerate dehydrogenase-like enzyme
MHFVKPESNLRQGCASAELQCVPLALYFLFILSNRHPIIGSSIPDVRTLLRLYYELALQAAHEGKALKRVSMKAVYLLDDNRYDLIYGQAERDEIAKLLDITLPQMSRARILKDPPAAALNDVEAIVSGWGMPKMDPGLMALFPNLKIIFYGAGSIKGFATPEMWAKGIRVVSAWAANAIPVADFTLAEIILSLKNFWSASAKYKQAGERKGHAAPPAGIYKSTVGLLSLGMIGKLVINRLKPFDLNILAFDPFVSQEQGRELGCTMVSLDDVFRLSDVVSCHTPWLKETEKMITGNHFELMKQGATFINTARGAVVDEPGMIAVLQKRPDIYAILDVTHPEPPSKDSPLFSLPNVVLSPHIAGSMGGECRRMGQYMIEEIKRYLAGDKLKYEITREMSEKLA